MGNILMSSYKEDVDLEKNCNSDFTKKQMHFFTAMGTRN
jgi:hypothetical protein